MADRIIAKIRITEYKHQEKLRYLAEINNKLMKVSFNESTMKKLLNKILKELNKGVYFN